jgi:hypothetical protein
MAATVTGTLIPYKVLGCSSTDFWQVDPGHLYIPRAWQGVARSARLRGARTAVL